MYNTLLQDRIVSVLYWGDGKILKTLYIVGSGVLTPLFYEDPPILPTLPPFFHLQPPPPMFFLLSCFLGEWVIAPHLMCYFTQ